jgi:ribosomal protein L11 methyltransferase
MLKFSSQIPSTIDGDAVCAFLGENDLVNWTVERDCENDVVFLCGYVENKEMGEDEFSKIRENFGKLADAAVAKIDGAELANAYKKFVRPWQCEDLHWIPSHLADAVDVDEGDVAVYIDPGMAFGSGAHQSTRLCARALIMFKALYKKTGDLVVKDCIDAGCGSGILGISALKIGMIHTTFIDHDPDAIRICRENAEANGLYADQMDFVVADLGAGLLGRRTDLLLANMTADVLVANADILVNSIKLSGLLCLGGILRSERDSVAKVFGQCAKKRWEMVMENDLVDGEWVSLLYFRG